VELIEYFKSPSGLNRKEWADHRGEIDEFPARAANLVKMPDRVQQIIHRMNSGERPTEAVTAESMLRRKVSGNTSDFWAFSHLTRCWGMD
jgi:hypothetical protein